MTIGYQRDIIMSILKPSLKMLVFIGKEGDTING